MPCPHVIDTRSNPSFSSDTTSYDVASNICQALNRGTGKSNTTKDIVLQASSDPGALKRAEWIKFISVFFNEEDKANLYFERESEAGESLRTSTRPTLCRDEPIARVVGK